MVFFRNISNYKGTCSLLSFGNQSWIGTPFGSSCDYLIPLEKEKKAKNKKRAGVSFEFGDDFKIS